MHVQVIGVRHHLESQASKAVKGANNAILAHKVGGEPHEVLGVGAPADQSVALGGPIETRQLQAVVTHRGGEPPVEPVIDPGKLAMDPQGDLEGGQFNQPATPAR